MENEIIVCSIRYPSRWHFPWQVVLLLARCGKLFWQWWAGPMQLKEEPLGILFFNSHERWQRSKIMSPSAETHVWAHKWTVRWRWVNITLQKGFGLLQQEHSEWCACRSLMRQRKERPKNGLPILSIIVTSYGLFDPDSMHHSGDTVELVGDGYGDQLISWHAEECRARSAIWRFAIGQYMAHRKHDAAFALVCSLHSTGCWSSRNW